MCLQLLQQVLAHLRPHWPQQHVLWYPLRGHQASQSSLRDLQARLNHPGTLKLHGTGRTRAQRKANSTTPAPVCWLLASRTPFLAIIKRIVATMEDMHSHLPQQGHSRISFPSTTNKGTRDNGESDMSTWRTPRLAMRRGLVLHFASRMKAMSKLHLSSKRSRAYLRGIERSLCSKVILLQGQLKKRR